MKFIIDEPDDIIQQYWARNSFYEENELKHMAQHIKPQSIIVDVGANIGNHAMWFDKNVNPKKIFVFEPHPRAISLMLQNAAYNYCHTICFDYIGCALGKKQEKCVFKEYQLKNLGGTKLKTQDDGFIDVFPGDHIFENYPVDFIKIDVEGMELDVLQGFEKTIKKFKPTIFIEIDNNNEELFKNNIFEYGYEIINVFCMYTTCKNYLIKSKF